MTATPKSFFKRIWIYSKEMFPVFIYLPYIVALYVCLNVSTQAISGQGIVIDIYGIVGMISAFFMMLLMRTYDDLKDMDIDIDLFPERATPRKAVLKSDISTLSVTSIIILLAVNILFARDIILVFAIMMIYTFLTFKWFFAEEIHRKKIFLTMATHQPIPYVINFYLIHTALASGGDGIAFNMNHFYLLLIFSLPVTAWEVSRKIRSADKETDYETFSMIFGSRGATYIPFVCLMLAGALSIYIGLQLNLSLSFYVITGAIMLYVLFFYTRFIIKPLNEYNVLKNTAMIFTTILFFNSLVHILIVSQLNMNY